MVIKMPKKPKVAVVISIGKPMKDNKKKYGGGPDMKKAGDPTRPFGKPMQPGDPLIDTKTGRDLDSTAPEMPRGSRALEHFFDELDAHDDRHYTDGEGSGHIDPEALRESNPEAFEMDDPRWRKREPAPRGYEYDDDGRLRRVFPEAPKDIFSQGTPMKRSIDPMGSAWGLLKALPEQQMFEPAYSKTNLGETRWDGEGFDAGEGQRAMGTVHPAIYGLLQREQDRRDRELMGADHPPRTGERALPNLNLETAHSKRSSTLTRPHIDSHPDWWEYASSGRRLG